MGFTKTIKNIWSVEDLRKRIGITLLLVIIYRFGCYVVLPGINPDDLLALKNFTQDGLMQLLDMFSGGAFSQASGAYVFAAVEFYQLFILVAGVVDECAGYYYRSSVETVSGFGGACP